MKKKDIFLLISLTGIAAVLLVFSDKARQGAYQGLMLAENTIIPSLLPLLIIFLMIMRASSRDVLAKALGFISVYLFNLPSVTFPAIFFGLVGGYPTGALLTSELFSSGEIDEEQAQRLMCFNFCGGCGFIITAVGSGRLLNTKLGAILLFSNIISNVLIGIVLSFKGRRIKNEFYSFSEYLGFGDAIVTAVNSAVKSVLSITAFIVLFSAVDNILTLPAPLRPVLEITSGVCSDVAISLPAMSAYLAFGGICIHLQLVTVISKCRVKYIHFFFSRVISALLSYAVTKIILLLCPIDVPVFSNSSNHLAVMSNVNTALSILLVIGCFVLVLDLNSRKKYA